MKNIKRKIKIIENFFWFIILAPHYVKFKEYKSPGLFFMLVSLFVWFCLGLYFIGLVFGVLSGSSIEWFKNTSENPYTAIDKFFAWGIITLSIFYIWATIKNLWNIEEIKKSLRG